MKGRQFKQVIVCDVMACQYDMVLCQSVVEVGNKACYGSKDLYKELQALHAWLHSMCHAWHHEEQPTRHVAFHTRVGKHVPVQAFHTRVNE